jgi:hypothetical protein
VLAYHPLPSSLLKTRGHASLAAVGNGSLVATGGVKMDLELPQMANLM